MSRIARKNIIAPNSLYHIVSRGNNEKKIYRSVRDYKKFLQILEKVKKEFPFFLYSFSLMPNHYHLKIETQDISISKIMHRINFLYVIYFHYRYKTSGHLFQDRFYSSLIEKDSYFWEAIRYIDLNPVRAGLVKQPENYKWGSYLFYYQKEYTKKLIDREKFLKYDGDDLEKARLRYLKFVEEGIKLKKSSKFLLNKKMI